MSSTQRRPPTGRVSDVTLTLAAAEAIRDGWEFREPPHAPSAEELADLFRDEAQERVS